MSNPGEEIYVTISLKSSSYGKRDRAGVSEYTPFDWSCSMTLQKLPCRALLHTRKCEEYQKRHKKAARKVDSPVA